MTAHRLEIADAVLLAELVIEGARCRALVPVGCPVGLHVEGGLSIDLATAKVVIEWDADEEPAS